MSFLEDRVEKIDNFFYMAGRNYSRLPPGRKGIHELLNDASENLPVIRRSCNNSRCILTARCAGPE
jgi:hypothetical protein